MRKLTAVLIALLLLLVGCTKETSVVQKPVENAKVYKLRMTATIGEDGPFGIGMKAWAQELEKRTNGQVKVDQMTWNGALLKADNNLEGIRDRIVDVAFISNTNHPTKTPLSNALLPAMLDDFAGSASVQNELWNTVPELKQEWLKWKVVPVAWFNGNNASLMTNYTFDSNSTQPLKGKKVFSVGSAMPTAVQRLGGIPLAMAVADVYGAMQKGTIDAVSVFAAHALSSYKMAEVSKQVTDYRLGGSSMWVGIAMNADAYNELPDSAKKAIADIANIPAQVEGKATSDQILDGYKLARKNNVSLVQLSPEEAANWQRLIDPPSLWEANIKAAENAGYKNVRQLMDKTVQMLKDYDAKNPHKTLMEQFFELEKTGKN